MCGFTVFTVFRVLTDFVCLYNYEFLLSLCKIVRSSVICYYPYLLTKLYSLSPKSVNPYIYRIKTVIVLFYILSKNKYSMPQIWYSLVNFWGISCEKSQFYAKKSYFFPILGWGRACCARPPGSAPVFSDISDIFMMATCNVLLQIMFN